MRNLTIKREKCYVASLLKMKVYIEDTSVSDIIINNVAYKKIGELKNGEEKTFSIDDNEMKVVVIADKLSKNVSNDFYKIPAGESDIYLSGKNKFNPMTGNAFRFNDITDKELLHKRKKTSIIGLAILILAFVIGGIIGYVAISNLSPDNTIVNPKEFNKSGMKITLTDKFTEKQQDAYTIYYESNEVLFLALKESFSDYQGIDNYTIEQYSKLILESNKKYSPSDINNNNGLTYFNYVYIDPNTNQTYKYFTALYKASDSFWIAQFVTPEDKYADYEEQIISWAKSITFYE